MRTPWRFPTCAEPISEDLTSVRCAGAHTLPQPCACPGKVGVGSSLLSAACLAALWMWSSIFSGAHKKPDSSGAHMGDVTGSHWPQERAKFSAQPSILPGLRAPDPPTPAEAWGLASLHLSREQGPAGAAQNPLRAPGEQGSWWSPTAQLDNPGSPPQPCRSHGGNDTVGYA